MNKYQEALKFLGEYSLGCAVTNHKDDTIKVINDYRQTLQELVDKETPKKPVIRGLSFAMHTCPICDKELIITNDETVIYKTKTNYCDNCGQKLDWSDNDE